ncbi:MAG: TetR/AcrR family transcriptional regulator [Crocinitomicaceae bacterium]|nr:TetR/AcrR family transcriptional regulator [Crocinitomicaceae bacterium]
MSTSKNQIIKRSRELFEKFGYQKTTLTDIAKSIGKVKSAVYYYFSGKEEIFAALVQQEAREFLDKLKAKVNAAHDPEEKIRVYIDARVNLMEQVAKKYSFLKSEFFELMPLVDENRRSCDIEEVEFLRNILEEINTTSNQQINNPSLSAMLLMQNIKGLEIQMYVTDQMQAHIEDRQAFIDFMLYGIFKNNK